MTEDSVLVSPVSVANQQQHDGIAFPLVLNCDSEASGLNAITKWLESHRSELLEQVKTHGVVLFRGFPVEDAEDFDQVVSAFDLENFPYQKSFSNAVRINFTPRVFSANEAPCEVNINLHHEMAQTPMYPRFLFFFCQKPAEQGGATPLCRSDVLLQRIQESHADFVDECIAKGLRYTNVMPADNDATSGMGRSWQSTFGVESKEAAEQRLNDLGYQWEWLDDGCLKVTTRVLPAVLNVSPDKAVFFNQLIAAFQGWKDSRNDPSRSIRFGDGNPLDREVVDHVAELAEELTFDLEWQRGDFALVDNCMAMHARRPFQGTRKVLASLVEARENRFDSNLPVG